MDVSIILVNYNGKRFLADCLNSVLNSQTQFHYEVIFVDNASTDGSIDELAPFSTKLTLIQNANNRGFPAANNQGLAIATGRYIFFLNTDTVISADTIQTLVEYADRHPNAGAISPKVLNWDGTIQIPGSPLIKSPYLQPTPTSVKFVSGAAFFTTASLMTELGGMDEAFFFYNDDIDLCMSIKKRGFDVIQLPNGDVKHFGGGSSKPLFSRLNYEGMRGGLYLATKHYPWLVANTYRVVLLLFAVLMTVLSGLVGKFGVSGSYLKLTKAILTNDIKNKPLP